MSSRIGVDAGDLTPLDKLGLVLLPLNLPEVSAGRHTGVPPNPDGTYDQGVGPHLASQGGEVEAHVVGQCYFQSV